MTATNDKARGQAGQGAQQGRQPEKHTTRCLICTSSCSRYWHRYCGRCRAWLRFAGGLRTMQAALREVRT